MSLRTAVAAARQAGIPDTRVVVFDDVPGSAHTSVEALIQEGLRMDQCFVERKLKPGEAKSKIAFLNFSSGTTGKPKVRALCARLGSCTCLLTSKFPGGGDLALWPHRQCHSDGPS
jgi:acyl-coenzyme A synthetase/AMP-(fatty) acid ligase